MSAFEIVVSVALCVAVFRLGQIHRLLAEPQRERDELKRKKELARERERQLEMAESQRNYEAHQEAMRVYLYRQWISAYRDTAC